MLRLFRKNCNNSRNCLVRISFNNLHLQKIDEVGSYEKNLAKVAKIIFNGRKIKVQLP